MSYEIHFHIRPRENSPGRVVRVWPGVPRESDMVILSGETYRVLGITWLDAVSEGKNMVNVYLK